MKQQQAYEEQLIGSWLMGENKEYIMQLNRFLYWQNILDCMQRLKTVDVFQIAKESKTSMSELMRMRTAYMPSMFEPSYKACKTEDIKNMLKGLLQQPKSIDVENAVAELTKEVDLLNCITEETPKNLFTAYIDELDRRSKEVPMKYGIPRIDYITGGIHRQELTIIAARPSIGKSALALQIATNVAQNGKRVGYFNLEMASEQATERIICRISDVPHRHLKNVKDITDEEWKKISFAGDLIPKTLYMYDRTLYLNEIIRTVERNRYDLAIIDYVGLMKSGTRHNSKREEITHISNSLKRATKTTGTPIILLAQLNRLAQDKPPTLAELKESGSLEEDADNVLFIHRLSQFEAEKINCFSGRYEFFEQRNELPNMLMLEKHRNGETGVVPAVLIGGKFVFREVES